MDALPPEPPPQWLPVGARWCVAPQRCIDLEVARSSEQQRLGLMRRPALPPLRGMWSVSYTHLTLPTILLV